MITGQNQDPFVFNPIRLRVVTSSTMRRTPPVFLAILFSLAWVAPAQEDRQATANSGFVLGVDTYFDFGPPFDYYEIFVVTSTPQGAKVGRFSLTPPAHKCYEPEKTEYVEKTTTLSPGELMDGVDPCKIPEKDLKKEEKRKHKETNFSGANVAMQFTCGGATRTIQTRVLERDWFLAHPGTPKNTNWTLQLLDKLRSLTGPGALDKPMFATMQTTSPAALSADAITLGNLSAGKYDALFPGATEKASEIYRASLIPPPQPNVTLVSSTPVQPIHFTLPGYPPLPRLVAHEGESSVIVRLDSQGNVSSVDMSTGSPLFQGTLRDAVKDWKFPPAPPTMDVDDPPRQVTVTFSFQLNCHADPEKE